MTEHDMMSRYIYQVVKRVPKEQQKEIEMELQELISDMAEGEDTSMDEVLVKLGNPADLAKRYRDDKRYVIGPEYYENYVWVMEIVMTAVLVSALVSGMVQIILVGSDIIEVFTETLANTITSVIGTFGIVTVIFAVLERQQVNVDLKKEKQWEIENLTWTPKLLLPIPDKKAAISRGESVISIVFIVIFCGLIIFAPQLIGAYIFEDEQFIRSIPIFNLNQWNILLPFLLLSSIIGFADEMVRLVTGCYCRLVMISNIISGSIQIALSVLILKVLPLWNADFIKDISEQLQLHINSKYDILSYWGSGFFSNIILVIICGAILLEMGITIYKTERYGL